MVITILVAAFAYALGFLYFDANKTDQGIRMGVGIEGSSLITFISGTDRPTLKQLLLIEIGVIRLPLFIVGLVTALIGQPFITALASVALFVAGVRNIYGGRRWAWCIKNPTLRLPVANTVWQKIIGVWV